MTQFERSMNMLLIKLYRSVEKLEQEILSQKRGIPLTISEIHLLEGVASFDEAEGATISDISDYLDISLPSVTLAVNKLQKKGYVVKEKCSGDGRVVRVRLTREGRRAERAHQYFHRSMVRAALKDLTREETAAVLRGVQKLDAFMDKNLQEYREKQ